MAQAWALEWSPAHDIADAHKHVHLPAHQYQCARLPEQENICISVFPGSLAKCASPTHECNRTRVWDIVSKF